MAPPHHKGQQQQQQQTKAATTWPSWLTARSRRWQHTRQVVLVIGPSRSGKTQLMQRLAEAAAMMAASSRRSRWWWFWCWWCRRSSRIAPQLEEVFPPLSPTQPTVGTELPALQQQGVVLREVGGPMQPLWPHYFQEAAAILFVVPAAEAAGQQDQALLVPSAAGQVDSITGASAGASTSALPSPAAAAVQLLTEVVLGSADLKVYWLIMMQGKPMCLVWASNRQHQHLREEDLPPVLGVDQLSVCLSRGKGAAEVLQWVLLHVAGDCWLCD